MITISDIFSIMGLSIPRSAHTAAYSLEDSPATAHMPRSSTIAGLPDRGPSAGFKITLIVLFSLKLLITDIISHTDAPVSPSTTKPPRAGHLYLPPELTGLVIYLPP